MAKDHLEKTRKLMQTQLQTPLHQYEEMKLEKKAVKKPQSKVASGV